MLLLGFSNTPVDKTYQIFMEKYKESHILQRSSQIKESYGRNVLLEIFIFSLLLFHLCGFLHLGTTPIILLCSINPVDYTVHGILQARILEWVTAFPLFLHYFTCLVINSLNLLFGIWGGPRRLKSFSTNKERRTQKCFSTWEGPAGYCLV